MKLWLQHNWFKFSFLFLIFLILLVAAIFTEKYERPLKNPEPVKPSIVYLVATSTLAAPSASAIDLPALIQEWYPSVVRVECYLRERSGELFMQSGSGFLTQQKHGIGVLTNRHVVSGDAGEIPELCTVQLVNNKYTYIVGDPSLRHKGGIVVSDTLDWGYIPLLYADADFKKAATAAHAFCPARAALGTGVVIMGYPSVGSESDITVTQGIISGYEENYYITDAKIGHGNSGGITVRTDKDSKASCLVGIPSFAIVGEVLNLGRVLDIASVRADPLFDF